MNRPREALVGQTPPTKSPSSPDTLSSFDPILKLSDKDLKQDTEHRWFDRELERSQELCKQIAETLVEIRELRSLLSQRYRPDLEGRVQRLSIERDEMIISWGQALLGLCDGGASLVLQTPSGKSLKLYPTLALADAGSSNDKPHAKQEVIGQTQSSQHQDFLPLNDSEIDDSRIFGEISTSQPFQEEPNEAEISASRQADADSDSIDLTDESFEDELHDDPGIADAPRVSLTQFSLDDLREQMLSPKSWVTEPSVDDETDENSSEMATKLVIRLGRPRELTTGQIKEHLIELEAEVECCQSWSVFEQEIQHAVVTLVTSRLRAMQDHIGESPFDQDRIAKMFRRLTRFSSDFRPGFIHGLSREKIPEHESWQNDEKHAWSRLETSLNIKPKLPNLSPERAEQLDHIRDILSKKDQLPDFSNALRAAVTECLNSGFTQESPHLVKLLEDHLSHLSGKRFKKLRLAASHSRF